MFSCGSEPETISHFLLRCQNQIVSRTKLFKNLYNLDQTLPNYDDDHLIYTLLYGSEKFNLLFIIIIIIIIITLLHCGIDFLHIFTLTLESHSLV